MEQAIYFQAIKGRSIVSSAVELLPLIVCSSVFSIISGVLVTKTLYFTPPAIIGTGLTFVGSGLLTTLHAETSTAKCAGYQIMVGTGLGLALQTGIFGVQAVLPAKDIPVGTSLMTFAQKSRRRTWSQHWQYRTALRLAFICCRAEGCWY